MTEDWQYPAEDDWREDILRQSVAIGQAMYKKIVGPKAVRPKDRRQKRGRRQKITRLSKITNRKRKKRKKRRKK